MSVTAASTMAQVIVGLMIALLIEMRGISSRLNREEIGESETRMAFPSSKPYRSASGTLITLFAAAFLLVGLARCLISIVREQPIPSDVTPYIVGATLVSGLIILFQPFVDMAVTFNRLSALARDKPPKPMRFIERYRAAAMLLYGLSTVLQVFLVATTVYLIYSVLFR